MGDLREAMKRVNPAEYITLLDYVRSTEHTMREFITVLAKANPVVFEEYARLIHYDNGIDSHIKSGKFISAIKQYRKKHNVGLKDAKEACENRRETLRKLGYDCTTK